MRLREIIAIAILGLIVLIMLISGSCTAHQPSEEALTVSCARRLDVIRRALLQYAGDHAGFFPAAETAKVLRTQDYLGDDVLVCPWRKDMAGRDGASYIFLSEGKIFGQAPGDIPLVMDNLGNHGGNPVNVIYGPNGNAQRVPVEKAYRLRFAW